MALVALVLVAAACGANPTSSDEYQQLQSDYEALTAERDRIAADLEEAQRQQTSLEESVAEHEQAAAQLEQRTEKLSEETAAQSETISDLEGKLASAEEHASSMEDELSDARDKIDDLESTVEELLLQYDPQIRAELQAEYDAEVVRACEQAKEQYERSIGSIVRWDSEWEPIATRANLVQDVEECSAEERSKTAAEREAERLAACETIRVDEVEKNPDGFIGDCFVMWANITQWDVNTGTCSFRADLSARRSTRWYDYEGNSFFTTSEPCPELDNMDVDDFVKVWATGAGSLTYDTQIGGSTTAMLWTIEKIELVKKG